MICPRCLENNPDNYQFCGMCGNTLQSAKPASGAQPNRTGSRPDPVRGAADSGRAENTASPSAESRGTAAVSEPVEPIAGPSLLGLNQATPNAVHERAFSGMESYYAERRSPWGRIFLTLLFVAGLCAVGWWRYSNYGGPGHGKPTWLSALNRTPEPANNPVPDLATKPADENKSAAAGESTPPANQAGAAPTPEAPATADDKNAGSQTSSPQAASQDSSTTSRDTNTSPEASKPDKAAAAPAKPADKSDAADQNASAPEKTAPKAATVGKKNAGADADGAPVRTGASAGADALFRRGEAYLYGQGTSQNCDQAIRYLKSASEKSHARARSTFGTMYATGHCVPRDLPTSYRWFALALQADPNNQILEKDLNAVWNQMTPPERQMATKMKNP